MDDLIRFIFFLIMFFIASIVYKEHPTWIPALLTMVTFVLAFIHMVIWFIEVRG